MDKSVPDLPPFYAKYANLISDAVLTSLLEKNGRIMVDYVSGWTPTQAEYRYAPGKWSAREVIMHLIDSERIFAYRALRFARNDTTSLPGFDENAFAAMYADDQRQMPDLTEEMKCVRTSTIQLFKSFTKEALNRKGEASGVTMTVRSIGEIIAGHELHHKKVLEEKYFPK